VVVKLDGPALLCKTDEVGELCLSSNFTGTGYWGLPGMSNSSFKVCRQASVVIECIDCIHNVAYADNCSPCVGQVVAGVLGQLVL